MDNDKAREGQPLLTVSDLKKYYKSGSAFGKEAAVRAVDGVSLDVATGTTLGLVGESGCGKSTLGKTILNLERPTSGRVLLEGQEISRLGGERLRALRKDMQIVFQDPYASLNGRMRVRQILAEPFEIHGLHRGRELARRVEELIERVKLPQSSLTKYPHQFSGGQRQRIGIARAIALNPKFIVCDEPVSALDVSIQAQIINLFLRLQEDMGLTYLFISHDLSVVRHISDRVGVMYLGKLMELGGKRSVFSEPLHPYTKVLMSAIPVPNPKKQRRRERIRPQGEMPSAANPPSGCRFRTRCPFAEEKCELEVPEWREVRRKHWVACHFAPLDRNTPRAN